MRYAHITTACGCSMPGLSKAASRGIDLAKAEAQGATPGRRRPVSTNVARYVEAKAPGLARKLRKVLRAAGKRAAGIAAKAYAETLRKDDGTAALIEGILRNLGSNDLGADLLGELANAMLAAFRRAAALGATQVGVTLGDDALNQVDAAALEYAKLRGAELIKDLAGTTDDAMRHLLVRAIGEGMAPATLAKEIQALGTFSDARAEMIARTELAFAHVQGNVAGWRATGEVDRKRWLLADTHPAPDECDEADAAGIIGLDDEFPGGIDFPPAHPNACFQGTTFASYGELHQIIRARYSGPAIFLVAERSGHGIKPLPGYTGLAPNFRRFATVAQCLQGLLDLINRNRNGSRVAIGPWRVEIAIGPNHPVLTERGFVAAGDLTEGDQLVYDALAQHSAVGAAEPDFKKVMLFEDAFSALATAGGASLVAGPAGYFHGDEAFTYGEVKAVRPARGLLPVLDTVGLQHAAERDFVGANAGLEVGSAPSDGRPVFSRMRLTTHGIMRWLDDLRATLRRKCGPPRFHLFRVVSCHRVTFSGFAFDASTQTGLYNNGGIVVKNCLCDVLPVLRDLPDEKT